MYEIEYGSLKNFWAIGDVHGCYEEFDLLCRKIKDFSPHSIIYQLGDLFDRGPGLIEVCQVIREHSIRLVIGNHDLSFLQEVNGYKPCNSRARQKTLELFHSYSTKDQKYVLQTIWGMRNYQIVCAPTNPPKIVLVSHSPVANLEHFKDHNLYNNARNFCTYASSNSDIVKYGFDYSIHGHQHWNYEPIRKQLEEGRVNYNIDGGCCYGYELVALRLDLGAFEIVKSFKQYAMEQKR